MLDEGELGRLGSIHEYFFFTTGALCLRGRRPSLGRHTLMPQSLKEPLKR